MNPSEYFSLNKNQKLETISSRLLFQDTSDIDLVNILSNEPDRTIVLKMKEVLSYDENIQKKISCLPLIEKLFDGSLSRDRKYDFLSIVIYRK
ncbi:MAG: hypothetical protein ACFE9L_04350 [Candidatus Hodarchaeota archaeon]